MNALADLPLWVAIPAAILMVLGATLTLVGSFGLYSLKTFYERLHAPTLGTSWGAAGIVLASAIIVTTLRSRPVVHELLIALFITITTPVTLMLLGRAVIYRDQAEGANPLDELPAQPRAEAEGNGADTDATSGDRPGG